MESTRSTRVKEVFLLTSEAKPSERGRILDEECGRDSVLRAQVESLLEHEEKAPGDFLEPPPAVARAAEQARTRSGSDSCYGQTPTGLPLEQPGQRIGRYSLIEKVGEGGFGVVWEAEQVEPIRRRVALKLIKLGMDTKQVLRRFEVERQALARMDHPNIARVLDAGSTETGRPFFVMEFVEGAPLLDYCAARELDIPSRVELLAIVCRAIHHAHQKGVIHRDIKPTNVLVAEIEGEATPKVIDFGIAKATHADSSTALLTQQRQLLGTPAYMSPEQAELGERDVDTRTDIYSLGVLLYELLTGTTPFESDGTASSTLGDIVRSIREDEPPRPSTFISASSDHFSEDLDWIVMRCLEKERDRRYASAHDMAADLRRHLADEPVLAGPPSLGYRTRKLYRRNRAAILLGTTIAAAVFLFLGAGFGWTAWKNHQLARTNELLDERNVQLAEERTAAQDALRDVERLSEGRLLDGLEARAETELWPALPEKLDAMSDWIDEAEELLERADRHAEELASLREGALPREGESGSWEFATTEQAWLHGLLSELVARFERFGSEGGTLASVEERFFFANQVEARTIHQPRLAWQESDHYVRSSGHYPELVDAGLEPQLGLIPLGPDPDSGLLEFLHLASHFGPVPERDAGGNLHFDNETGVILVLLPGGEAALGSQSEDPLGSNYDPGSTITDEPLQYVRLEPFFLSKFEMTQAQWRRVDARGLEVSDPDSHWSNRRFLPRNPVDRVSWFEANRIVRRADLDLPFSSQWEYGARGGASTPWPTGSKPESLSGFANLRDATARLALVSQELVSEALDDGFVGHAPVGTFLPNAFGLHDVVGNLSEWCRSEVQLRWKGALDDEADWLEERRIARGGCHASLPDRARLSHRQFLLPRDAQHVLGLRPARPLR